MATVFRAEELDALDAFRMFGIRNGDHLPVGSYESKLHRRLPGRDLWELAESLAAKGAIEPDGDGNGYFLRPLGGELLYGLADDQLKEPNMTSPSTDRERLARRSENRYRFIRALYDATGGTRNAYVSMWELGAELHLSREETRDAVDFLRGERLLDPKTLGGGIGITHDGVREVEASINDPSAPTTHFAVSVINNFHGPVINQSGTGHTAYVGNSSSATIGGSTGGSVAVGPNATASLTSAEQDTAISKSEFDAVVAAAQRALVDDHERLAQISDGLSDGLWQILSTLRRVEFAVASVGEVQAQIKNTIDDNSVTAVAAQLKGGSGTKAFEFAKALLASPVTAEFAKRLSGS